MRLNGPNGLNGPNNVQKFGAAKANAGSPAINPLNVGGTDSVQFSSAAKIGTSPQHNVDFGAISQMSLGDAAKQFQAPNTMFGLGLF